MLILHIMASRGLGGAETYSTDVMLSLHQAGVAQCVVMPRNAPRYAELQKAGLHMAPWVLAIPFRPLQKELLKRLVAQRQPDVIHCWMRRAASLMPKPKAESRDWGSEKKNLMPDTGLPPTVGWFGGYYNPQHFRRCTHFVGVTKDIVAHMIKNGVPSERTHFIPTFPDIAAMPPIDRESLATPAEAKILLTLSRLHPKKGLDTFLTALKDLPECYAWLAGDGPLRRELESLANKLDLSNRVRFLGWRTDRTALLRAADVCVLPSRYEPFGTVILEAWATGTPLVACRSAGPQAHIEDGVTGMLVPVDDPAGLVKAIRSCLSDESLRHRLTTEGHATYIKNYTREAVTREWLNYYNTLVKNSLYKSDGEAPRLPQKGET